MTAACPYDRCDGTGFLVDETRRRAEPCPCRPQRISRARARALSAVIPRRYRGVSFDRPPVTQMDPRVVRAVRAYVDDVEARLDAGEGCWFTGDVGTGKTTLAMLISQAALEAGRSVAIYSLPRLLAELRKTFEEKSELSFLGLMDRLSSVELLHIDDLGAEKTTPWVLEQLYALVNARYEDGRALVVTTNLGHEDLREQIGERTVSRLIAMCGDPLPLYGPDMRIEPQLPPGLEDPGFAAAAAGTARDAQRAGAVPRDGVPTSGDDPGGEVEHPPWDAAEPAWGTTGIVAGYGDPRFRTAPPGDRDG